MYVHSNLACAMISQFFVFSIFHCLNCNVENNMYTLQIVKLKTPDKVCKISYNICHNMYYMASSMKNKYDDRIALSQEQ